MNKKIIRKSPENSEKEKYRELKSRTQIFNPGGHKEVWVFFPNKILAQTLIRKSQKLEEQIN